jgi:hypothetical protein
MPVNIFRWIYLKLGSWFFREQVIEIFHLDFQNLGPLVDWVIRQNLSIKFSTNQHVQFNVVKKRPFVVMSLFKT